MSNGNDIRHYNEFNDEYECIVTNKSSDNESRVARILEMVRPGFYDYRFITAIMISRVFPDDVWVCKRWFPTRTDAPIKHHDPYRIT